MGWEEEMFVLLGQIDFLRAVISMARSSSVLFGADTRVFRLGKAAQSHTFAPFPGLSAG